MIASSSTRRPQTVDDLVSPQVLAALDRVDLSTRRLFAGKLQGERRSKARGRSVEFEDFRPYVHGDDLRHVDWNVFARLDRFFIKIFQEEQDLALHIVLDASASMDAGNPNKLIFAQKLAMALGYVGLVNNNRVAMWTFGGLAGERFLRRLPPMRGQTSVQRLAKFILGETFPEVATRPEREDESFSKAIRSIAASRTGRGIMVVISDLLAPEGYQQGLSLLAGASSGTSASAAGRGGWDTTLLQVLSPGEIDPALERTSAGDQAVIGDLRLTDAETGRATEVTISADLLARYKQRFEAYQQELHTYALSRNMQHLVVRSDADVSSLLLDDLRRRGLVSA